MKKVNYTIKYCNSTCPFFYHNYDDHENIWCEELNKRVLLNDCDEMFDDFKHRDIPENCPLEDA